MVGPGGLHPYCNSNDLIRPAGVNGHFENKRLFPQLSSPPDPILLVHYESSRHTLAEAQHKANDTALIARATYIRVRAERHARALGLKSRRAAGEAHGGDRNQ